MATLATINGTKNTVFANDHLPPHFHIRAPQQQLLVRISDLTDLRGEIHPQVRRTAWPWIEANRAAIAAEWDRLHPEFPARGDD